MGVDVFSTASIKPAYNTKSDSLVVLWLGRVNGRLYLTNIRLADVFTCEFHDCVEGQWVFFYRFELFIL